MTADSDHVRAAARLVYKGLAIGRTPASDREYGELVRKYLADSGFRILVGAIADAMDLQLLDAVTEERGILLAPASPESRFAWRLSDIRSGMEDHEKAIMIIAHLSIAACFFPTAESIEEANTLFYPVAFATVRDRMLGLATGFADRERHAQAVPEELRSGWSYLAALPLRTPAERQIGMRSLEGVLKLAFTHLEEGGCVKLHEKGRGLADAAYLATPRFAAQLREFALPHLFELAQDMLRSDHSHV
jgi:hypothetical protein